MILAQLQINRSVGFQKTCFAPSLLEAHLTQAAANDVCTRTETCVAFQAGPTFEYYRPEGSGVARAQTLRSANITVYKHGVCLYEKGTRCPQFSGYDVYVDSRHAGDDDGVREWSTNTTANTECDQDRGCFAFSTPPANGDATSPPRLLMQTAAAVNISYALGWCLFIKQGER
ncbi:hypothetical protein VOLCADRAFT_96707 [Volvox carteri f. nagariensis]|uniref:Uncharacterized protein n=1 Tax=Volvox carteri f. nagariensis TaxID=3068 RepID=D8UAU6_VOLCA|nr:uncharacterized protein VOLCADRAFT_96707 [Volvox carteri f. nagariensis]EFJ43220.1 hypothetical protein VOLCADRAFT_96707 [Volvox carteri f. nagariensis]|eukprot:XP_002955795.1 hypothetical protein VOLCADRAFT_96707 [Volvox carteri f. nagariensis]